MRIVAANWKMNKTRREAVSLAEDVLSRMSNWAPETDILLFPPFTAIGSVADVCQGSRVVVGGQNLNAEASGAFTGEVSARMLLEAGAESVLIGHSERRTLFEETDAQLAAKLKMAFRSGLRPILCVGENLEIREAGRTEEVLRLQLSETLPQIEPESFASLVVAYEPVWAIGTGLTASLDQIEAAHQFIRGQLQEHSRPAQRGDSVPILYGGSVKGENAGSIFGIPAVDGVLVGGASLDIDAFEAIVRA